MIKLGKIKTLTIASLSAVALAAPIAFAQSSTTTQDTPQATGERAGQDQSCLETAGACGRRGSACSA